jgi:hypothetical protein
MARLDAVLDGDLAVVVDMLLLIKPHPNHEIRL